MDRHRGGPSQPARLPKPGAVGASDRAPAPSARADRRAIDEAAADEARRRLHERGIVPIEPDRRIGVMLEPGELVVTVRHATEVDRRQPEPVRRHGLGGDLYVTTRRLIHLGRGSVVYRLDDIHEAVVVGDQLRLVVCDGTGVSITVADPRLLRVEIAAARAACAGGGPAHGGFGESPRGRPDSEG